MVVEYYQTYTTVSLLLCFNMFLLKIIASHIIVHAVSLKYILERNITDSPFAVEVMS